MQAARIERRSNHGVDSVLLHREMLTEASINVHVDGDPDLPGMLAAAAAEVRALGLTVLRQDVFGTSAQHETAPEILRRACGDVTWPVTWLEEGASLGDRLTGTHLYAVAGVPVARIEQDGRILGSTFSDGFAEYAHLGGVVGKDLSQPAGVQTRSVLEQIDARLEHIGMDFGNVVRTWFYNDRILEWYDDFNSVRTAFFNERGIFDGLVPASTGVGGGNRYGAALVADALAVKSLNATAPQVTVQAVESPLQCPATAYRSSFSRAVQIEAPDHRKLLVSGTASIAPGGETVRQGDVAGQTDLTLDVVEAILRSRGMDWRDVSRAIAYVKNGRDIDMCERSRRERGAGHVPAIVTENDICRGDLLYELELDAITAGTA